MSTRIKEEELSGDQAESREFQNHYIKIPHNKVNRTWFVPGRIWDGQLKDKCTVS